jgi:hypothetical protein
VLLVAVLPCDPPKAAIVLPLQEEAADPKVLSDARLVVESILFLADVDADGGLLEDGESPHGGGVIGRQLEVLAFGFFLGTRLDGFGRVDGAGGGGREPIGCVEEDRGEEGGQLHELDCGHFVVVGGVVVAEERVGGVAVLN